jgi:predicted nucleotidyltransferase
MREDRKMRANKSRPSKKRGLPDPKVLADIVRRIVDASDPERIILFGSAARGQMGPNSDLDTSAPFHGAVQA